MKPGEYLLDDADGTIELNAGRQATRLLIKNLGDRPIQVGSHFHFYEVNTGLEFEREKAYGLRLNVAAGTSVRFEPGDEKEVDLVPFGGAGIIYGHNGKVNGTLKAQ